MFIALGVLEIIHCCLKRNAVHLQLTLQRPARQNELWGLFYKRDKTNNGHEKLRALSSRNAQAEGQSGR